MPAMYDTFMLEDNIHGPYKDKGIWNLRLDASSFKIS